METEWTDSQKNQTLCDAFAELKGKITNNMWLASESPFTELRQECINLMLDSKLRNDIENYLRQRTVVRRAIQMFFTYVAMAMRAKWDEVPKSIRGVTARGYFLGKWLPAFLVVDGPIGRFLDGPDSPLAQVSRDDFPMLYAAKEFLRQKEFHSLRNGFAHWGFDWEVIGNESYVVAYDWENDLPSVKLHQREADAYYLITLTLIQILYDVIINPDRS